MGLEEASYVGRELIHELKTSGGNPKTRAARASRQQYVGRPDWLTVVDCFDVALRRSAMVRVGRDDHGLTAKDGIGDPFAVSVKIAAVD